MKPTPQSAQAKTLDRSQVVAEALHLVNQEGFDRLTMRNLAARLGVVPMALYRHVTNKEELIDAVFELALSDIKLPDPDLTWRPGLDALARAIRELLLEHPPLAVEVVGRPTLGPASLRIAEYGYRVMRTSGFSDIDTNGGINTLVTYVIGFTALEVPRRHSVGANPPPDLSKLQSLYADLPADQFPHTVQLQPQVEGLVTPEQFDRGLTTLLDGLEHRLQDSKNAASQCR
ncbi:MAG: TetR/AcrR family transcriptional regulator C-terminal domain-containing protein [Acidimicrobiia bacterium]|nr:TetR/AcrR family transcriptional regulator C-terminal domain-containing protein [Acidimicrobiia bacterium]